MTPVITSTLGRWVAIIKCIPAARAICANRQMASSTSLGAAIIRSANSSMIMTIFRQQFQGLLGGHFVVALDVPDRAVRKTACSG